MRQSMISSTTELNSKMRATISHRFGKEKRSIFNINGALIPGPGNYKAPTEFISKETNEPTNKSFKSIRRPANSVK